MKTKKLQAVIFSGVLLLLIKAEPSRTQDKVHSADLKVEELVQKVCRRLASYPDFEKWQAEVVSSYIYTDKNWLPEKIRRVKKRLLVDGDTREEEILEAVEIEKGKTRDITEVYRQQRLERLKKLKEEAEKARKKGQQPATKNQLTKDDLIPFSEKRKNLYQFFLLGEELYQGVKVFVIEARAKEKNENLFEGLYYINQATFDPLKMVLQPSRFPKFIREFQVEVELEPWEGLLMLKKSRLRVYGGFLFKSVRMMIEEDYASFRPVG
ncbi:MAG: hypothetical protein H5U07_00410 [Candidatus Aminicenantes bacterium]|nr:hypothetical protein [Candidatus Aminicenantes bacterium]